MMAWKEGIICTRWQGTVAFLVVSNCIVLVSISTIERKAKYGSKKEITYPDSIMFYDKFIGGEDHPNLMIS